MIQDFQKRKQYGDKRTIDDPAEFRWWKILETKNLPIINHN